MSFQDLDIQIRYRSNEHNFPVDFLIPVLEQATVYKRSVGFFSTTSLIELSTGLFAMAKNQGKVLLVCSPELSPEDINAIHTGYRTRDDVFAGVLKASLTTPLTFFEEERLNLVANMIASGMMELKLAFMETSTGINIYHEKIAVLEDVDGNKIGFTGSMNDSANGFGQNFESIYTFSSWKDDSQLKAVNQAEEDFDNLWHDNTNKLKIIPFPKVVIDRLMQYKKDRVDYSTDRREYHYTNYLKKDSKFQVPSWISLRPYQSKAIDAWFNQQCRGIYSMCTGAGKTITALAATEQLASRLQDKLAVFIVCPYIHLVSQWEEDVVAWCPAPIIAHSKSTTPQWEERLRRACLRFRREQAPFVCITTNDTFCSDKVQPLLSRFSEEDNLLIIVDEAHNFGAQVLSGYLPQKAKYRIALSATIKRYMDKAGTNRLFDYFGNECITYGLEEAINDGALVPYDYYPIPVYLEKDELEKFIKISKELKKHLVSEHGKLKIGESGKHLIYKRIRLLAGARAKIGTLMELMQPYREKKNILVYCGATMAQDDDGTEQRQIDKVTSMLRTELKMSAQRFTASEGLKERQNIKEYFRDGLYQVITAIKCLDEGVNIPGICTAFILSSSRNPKEFIQRRGRLLRLSPGKDRAVIYDFVTLPRNLDDVDQSDYETDRSIILGELARIHEFGQLADNRIEAETLKNRIMDSYGTYIDIEEEVEKLEEYYGDEW